MQTLIRQLECHSREHVRHEIESLIRAHTRVKVSASITLSDQMQLEAKSILQVLGRWSRRPDFSRLRQLRHADTTPDSLRILDLQIYSLNWLSYGPRAWPLSNQMPPPPPNKSQTPVRTHSYHLITLILHRSLLFCFFCFFVLF